MDRFLKVEVFIQNLFDKSHRITLKDWNYIFNSNDSSYWGSWLCDYTLRKCFEKMDALDEITVIDLTGQSLITDQGIVWMSKYLSKCTKLEKISLRSCSKLTENSLMIMQLHLRQVCIIEMNHTNVNFKPQPASFLSHVIQLRDAPMRYSSFITNNEKNVRYSWVMWPSSSLTISGIGLLTEHVARQHDGNFFEYKPNLELYEDAPLINIINYVYTNVPIHALIPSDPGHVIILVSDNVTEAIDHIVNSISYFLSSSCNVLLEDSYSKIIDPFTVIIYGSNSQIVYDEVTKLDWEEALKPSIVKLKELIDAKLKEVKNEVDVTDCLNLSDATRQLEKLKKFIFEIQINPLSVFQMTSVDENVIHEILNSIKMKIAKEKRFSRYKFSESKYTKMVKEILSTEMNYVTKDFLHWYYQVRDIDHTPSLLEKMFQEMSGIYYKKFEMFVLNIKWFDTLCHAITHSMNIHDDLTLQGVPPGSRVWTHATISTLFELNKITKEDHQLWISIFEDLGLLILLPCIRFSKSDENYLYINPLESYSWNQSEMEPVELSTSRVGIIVTVTYDRICQDLYSLYPPFLAMIVSIGNLQFMSPAKCVIHISGGIELDVQADADYIVISVHFVESPDIKYVEILRYIWSIIYMCTDAFESLLLQQNILARRHFNRDDDRPYNYSVCYNHTWSKDPANINVCTLCGNCASGKNCHYNRIRNVVRGYCQCRSTGSSCQNCGICKSCARTQWMNYCTSHPQQKIILGPDGSLQPHESINFAMSPKITIQFFTTKSEVFLGIKPIIGSEIIDILGVTERCGGSVPIITKKPIRIDKSLDDITSVTVSFSEAENNANNDILKTLNQFVMCQNIDYNSVFKLLTCYSSPGLFVCHQPITRERNCFTIEILSPGDIVIGLIHEKWDRAWKFGTKRASVGYFSNGDLIISTTMTNTEQPFMEAGSKIGIIVEHMQQLGIPDKKIVIFTLNGIRVAGHSLLADDEVFPAIGMYSELSQVRLLDDDVWQCDQVTDETGPDTLVKDNIRASPEKNIRFVTQTSSVGFLHLKSNVLKTLTLHINCKENVMDVIKSLNHLPSQRIKGNKVEFKLPRVNSIDMLSFAFDFQNKDNVGEYSLSMAIKTTAKTKISLYWKFSRPLLNIGNKSLLRVSEVNPNSKFPPFPAHIMSILKNGQISKYYIPKDDYCILIQGKKNDFCLKCENVSSFICSAEHRNTSPASPDFQSEFSLKELSSKHKGHKLSRQMSKRQTCLLTISTTDDGKFKQISDIDKTLLQKPRPVTSTITVFPEEIYNDNQSFIPNKCNIYHGMNICLLNLISMYQDSTVVYKELDTFLPLPLPDEVNTPLPFLFSDKTFEEFLSTSNLLFFSICAGINQNYNPRPHCLILDLKDVEGFNGFKFVYQNISLLHTYNRILNDETAISKLCKMLRAPISEFNINVHFLWLIVEKMANYMLLNHLFVDDSYLCNNDKNEIRKCINEKYHCSIFMDNHGLACGFHSNDFPDKIDLEELLHRHNGNAEYILNHTVMRYARFAQSVILTGHKLPDHLFPAFSNLNCLELHLMPRTETLPESTYTISELEKLTIFKVNLKKMPDVWKFKNLKQLSISYCPISSWDDMEKFPTVRRNMLKSLESVKLVSLQLTTVPNFLFFTNNLSFLELQLNGLVYVPPEIIKANNLKELKLDGHYKKQDNEYPNDDMESTAYTQMELFDVPRIGSGYSTEKDTLGLGGFPRAILMMRNLTSLCINYQSIRRVPKEVETLDKLEYIDLQYNHLLESIAGEISNITTIKHLSLLHCPGLVTPPLEVISSGTASILAYLKFSLEERLTCNRGKLMFVGLGEAGKTTLLKALKSADDKAPPPDAEDRNITDGIDIDTYKATLPDNSEIEFSTWDFAGQDVYYNTHQFFLSRSAIYIVVWSVRLGLEYGNLDFWLSSITCHVKDAPIFVVGSKCDKIEMNTSSFSSLKERYSQIVEFHLVDSFTGQGISELRNSIFAKTLNTANVRKDIPSTILNLETKIIELRKSVSYVKYDEFESLALSQGIKQSDVQNVTQILHDFGSILYFNIHILKDYIVIRPQWIIDVLSNVVSVVNSHIKNGIFKHENMGLVWKDADEKVHQWMLKLTEEFDLTYPHPNTEMKANNVPCLMNEEQPKIEWPICSQNMNWKYFQISYTFQFLPAGLFNRIQVRLFDFTEIEEIWKCGIYFKKNDHHVLLKLESKSELSVRAIGVRPVNVIAMVDEVIKTLVQTSFPGIAPEMNISCPECIETGTDLRSSMRKGGFEVSMFKTSLIKKAIQRQVEYLQCSEFHLVSLSTLQSNSPDTSYQEKFLTNLCSKVGSVKGMNAISTKIVLLLHSEKDFSERLLSHEEFEKTFKEYKLTRRSISEKEVSITESNALVKNCCLCIIVLSENFLKISHMKSILSHVIRITKPFLLIYTDRNQNTSLGWDVAPRFNGIYIRFDKNKPELFKSRYAELKETIKKFCDDRIKQEEPFQCFISYNWDDSIEALKHGGKYNELCEENHKKAKSDPRKMYNYLTANKVKCWIDKTQLVCHMALCTQLSLALYNSRIMIAFVSNEYVKSPNCMMELRFMAEILKRPIIFVNLGLDPGIKGNNEVFLLMQKSKMNIDFQTEDNISEVKLLEIVLSNCEQVESSTTNEIILAKESYYVEITEQIELIRRQFLNELIRSDFCCPRLVVLDIRELKEYDTQESMKRLELRIICEDEGRWHLTEDSYPIDADDKNFNINNYAVYLHMLYQILEPNNLGLRCLIPAAGYTNDLPKVIEQSAKSSNLSFNDSYNSIIKFYMKMDSELQNCSLKRYRLASGRELWMCSEDARRQKRCRLIEGTAATGNSRLNPIDDTDTEIYRLLKSNATIEQEKFGALFTETVYKEIADRYVFESALEPIICKSIDDSSSQDSLDSSFDNIDDESVANLVPPHPSSKPKPEKKLGDFLPKCKIQ